MLSQVYFVLFSCLAALLVAVTSGMKPCERELETVTCSNETGNALISVGKGSFTLMLKLQSNGKAYGRGKEKDDSSEDSSESEEQLTTTTQAPTGGKRRRRDTDEKEKKGGKPETMGKPDTERMRRNGEQGRPDGKGPPSHRQGKNSDEQDDDENNEKKRPMKFCRPGLKKLRDRMKRGKKFGKPVTLRFIMLKLDGEKRITMPATPSSTKVCGTKSTALKDDNNAVIETTLYEVPYDFNYQDKVTARGIIRVFVLQQNATVQGVGVMKGDIKWDAELSDFSCTTDSATVNCSSFTSAEMRILVDTGNKARKSCQKGCAGKRKMADGSELAFPTEAKVDGSVNSLDVSFTGNLYKLRVNFNAKSNTRILVDPVAVPSPEEMNEADIAAEVEVGVSSTSAAGGLSTSLGFTHTVTSALFMFALCSMLNQ